MGFGYPRSSFPLVEPDGGFPYDPDAEFEPNSAIDLHNELINPSNFGTDGTVACTTEFGDFVENIESGLLVDGNGKIKYDVFFAGNIDTALTDLEAVELAKFITSGGVVHISVNPYIGNFNNYNKLFAALQINDRFTDTIDDRWFGGWTDNPVETPITHGKFGDVGSLYHGEFYTTSNQSMTGVTKGFEELDIIISLSQQTQSHTDSLNYNLFEKEIGSGYLSASGSMLYLNTNSGDNLKYFKNLFSFACRDVLGTSTEPFLELPWDYESNGMSFSKAALAINSYFDHEYPLLSASSLKAQHDSALVLNFEGEKNSTFSYTSHDGYDWGRNAGATYGIPQVAIASGVATYHNNCGPCGNTIYINHQNGIQTRYYHLKTDGLITNSVNQSVNVVKGQQIGLTGFTGNTSGAHIHFMVVEDKNKDGIFEDNIPDGLVDPFGWQSSDPDPWPNFSFFYNGLQRTGNTSSYLWLHNLDIGENTYGPEGGVVQLENNSIEFTENALSENLTFRMEYAKYFDSLSLSSIGPIIKATAKNASGEIINIFDAPFKMQLKIVNAFLENIDMGSLAIWSSDDGENWTKADTEIDWNVGTATAYFGHFSYFALMGTPIDTSTPVTTLVTTGDEGEDGWFRSDVELSFGVEDESGVQYTAVSINENEWENYSSPIGLKEDGKYIVRYYSEDEFGNLEKMQTAKINIDRQTPEISIHFDSQTKTLVFESDQNNVITSEESKGNKVSIKASNKAGNNTILSGHLIKHMHGEMFIPNEIQTGDVVEKIQKTWLSVDYKEKKNSIDKYTQTYKHPDGEIKIEYNSKKDTSEVSEKTKGDKWTKTNFDGMKVLTIQTNEGALEFSY